MNHQPSKLMMGAPGQHPSVIARLMGIDAIPPMQAKAAGERETISTPSTSSSEIKVCLSPCPVPSLKQAKCSLLSYHRSRTGGGDSRRCLKKMRVLAARSRSSRHRHPQEHLLQKIKEEFQSSWQASSKELPLDNNSISKHLDGRCIQVIAQENLGKEKMARYGFNGNNQMGTIPIQKQNGCSVKNVVQTSSDSGVVVAHQAKPQEKILSLAVNQPAASENLREVGKDGNDQSTSETLWSPAARIVLLKPSSSDDGELLFGLPKVKRDDSMDELLREVKERLQKELLLKVKCTTSDLRRATTTWRTQTMKQQADHPGKRLSRSEAFLKRNHAAAVTTGAKHASPEHVSWRNIILLHRPKKPTDETVSPKEEDDEGGSVDSFPVTSSRGRVMGFDELQTCTSRSECLIKNSSVDILPQRKLVRSFSAPELVASRISLFSDQSFRDHGASDGSVAMTSRTSSYSFRETVSSLRHRFGNKLFGRRKKPTLEEQLEPSESSSCFGELMMSPRELDARDSEAASSFRTDDISIETACNQQDNKAYLRQVLVAAGLYYSSYDDNNNNDSRAVESSPICDYDIFFDEVEDNMRLYNNNDNRGGNNATEDHRMLFDLANEALLQRSSSSAKSLGQWVIEDSTTGVSQRGRKLLDHVWQRVQEALRYPQMQEIEGMVAFDEVRRCVWSSESEVVYEDVYVVGRKIERAIFDELIQDLLLEEVFNCY